MGAATYRRLAKPEPSGRSFDEMVFSCIREPACCRSEVLAA